jgi:hypothetical protein
VPLKDQPTFNSNAIEQHLHTIVNISDQFLVWNDDCFACSYIHPSDLFTLNRGVKFFARKDIWGDGQDWAKIRQKPTPYLMRAALYHTFGLLEDRFGSIALQRQRPYILQHAPYSYHRKAFSLMQTEWTRAFDITSQNRFRSSNDVLTPVSLKIKISSSNYN